MLAVVFIVAIVLFALAYRFYGRFLNRHFEVDDNRKTPSHTEYDGVDKVPTKTAVLLGHHFSSHCRCGSDCRPHYCRSRIWVGTSHIVGNHWLNFIGGVHDFSSLIASIRHKARSIAEIAREYMSPLSYKLFLIFIWLAMVYILIVFIDLTSTTFVSHGEVATSSTLFIFLAMIFGIVLYRLKIKLLWASLIFVPLFLLVFLLDMLFLSIPTFCPGLCKTILADPGI
jgi:carbon starvation protein